jgi:hypothetical protein
MPVANGLRLPIHHTMIEFPCCWEEEVLCSRRILQAQEMRDEWYVKGLFDSSRSRKLDWKIVRKHRSIVVMSQLDGFTISDQRHAWMIFYLKRDISPAVSPGTSYQPHVFGLKSKGQIIGIIAPDESLMVTHRSHTSLDSRTSKWIRTWGRWQWIKVCKLLHWKKRPSAYSGSVPEQQEFQVRSLP